MLPTNCAVLYLIGPVTSRRSDSGRQAV